MSRFGTSITFVYQSGDSITSGTTITLSEDSLPNYPFETSNDTDRTVHKTLTGKKYIYENYNLQKYSLNFSNLSESVKTSFKRMWDAKPLLTIASNGTTWGTFRFDQERWQDSEVVFELYDVNMSFVESA